MNVNLHTFYNYISTVWKYKCTMDVGWAQCGSVLVEQMQNLYSVGVYCRMDISLKHCGSVLVELV